MRKETLLILMSTVISLFIAEIFLAFFFPQRTVNQYKHDRPAMYRPSETVFMDLKPGYVGFLKEEEFRTDISINSLGYRQAEFSTKKQGQKRIVVVGDSFTFGYGVDESDGYVRIIEKLLNVDKPGAAIEVINAGVPAWWTDAYYLYLKNRGLRLQPDVVIVGLFMGNDIDARDARHAIWPALDDAGLPLRITSDRVKIEGGYRVRTKPRARWAIPVLRNSHLFQLLYSSGKSIGLMFSPKIQAATLYEAQYSEETFEIIDKVQGLILAMRDMTERTGAKFVVVMIPERNQIYPAASTIDEPLDYDKPQRIFSDFFRRQNVPFFDLLPVIRNAAAATTEPLYYQKDSHFTALGYRSAGEAIAQYLRETGVVNSVESRDLN